MYAYVEYPKCLYRGSETVTVQTQEEEHAARADGWLTAAQFYQYPGAEPLPEPKKGKK